MPREYIEVQIDADEQMKERLVGIMSQIGFEGFWEDGETLKCYVSAERWQPAMEAEVTTIAQTVARSSVSPAPKVTVSRLKDRSWNEEWEKTIRPIRVTDRIVVTPTWHRYEPHSGETVLTIDPKMSFGTGYHETTRLALRLLEKYLKPGMRLLDVGTGTGILAIAGVRLGAGAATGIDNDEWSIHNAEENVRVNNVADRVRILPGEIQSIVGEQFDIIVANIQKNVIERLLGDMVRRLSAGGMIIVSGLLTEDRHAMRDTMRLLGADLIEEVIENEWIAFAVRFASERQM